jgi:hypothetical protein
MSIIPEAAHICLGADADDQPKGPSVVTPCVEMGLGRGTLDHSIALLLSTPVPGIVNIGCLTLSAASMRHDHQLIRAK